MKKTLSILLITFLCTELKAQELLYDILISGKRVGTMLVSREKVNEEIVYYSAVSDVKYSLFRSTELMYFYEASFKKEVLDKAYFLYKKNGDMEEESKFLWTKEGYQSTLSEKHLHYKHPMKKSMLMMYFEAPEHREEIFSERFHDFVKIGATEEKGKFIFYIPNGDKNIYYYNERGRCERISISSGLISFEMVLNQE